MRVAADAFGNMVFSGFAQCGLDFGGGVLPGGAGTPGEGEANLFLVKLDATGNHRWSKGWLTYVQPGRLVVDANHDTLFTAERGAGAIDLGGGALPEISASDLLLAKLGP